MKRTNTKVQNVLKYSTRSDPFRALLCFGRETKRFDKRWKCFMGRVEYQRLGNGRANDCNCPAYSSSYPFRYTSPINLFLIPSDPKSIRKMMSKWFRAGPTAYQNYHSKSSILPSSASKSELIRSDPVDDDIKTLKTKKWTVSSSKS